MSGFVPDRPKLDSPHAPDGFREWLAAQGCRVRTYRCGHAGLRWTDPLRVPKAAPLAAYRRKQCPYTLWPNRAAEGYVAAYMHGTPTPLRVASGREQHVLVHCLTGGTRHVYRNHYDAGDADVPLWEALVRKRWATRSYPPFTGRPMYHATRLGAWAVGLFLPR